ncbi:MAG: FMN-binding glutamate synthase family protein [Candidatus Bathyarchaeota archaeon]|nr:FMN-binding glutamate synthase family protein [Candidatus Bathyarchaeota archaeon]
MVDFRKKSLGEDEENYQAMVDLSRVADKGDSPLSSMGSIKKMPFSLQDLHFVPAQVQRIPLNIDEKVNTEIVIGPKAASPLKASTPIMFSGMSYGAVSKKIRLILATVASKLNVAVNSGEDVVLPEEIELAQKHLIIQYSPIRFESAQNALKRCSGVEIRFGQGAYPGWLSRLPGSKMTGEVAALFGRKEGEDEFTPAHHPDITNSLELKEKVRWLKETTGGVPVGAKIGCGNVEADVEMLAECGVDFIALDGFGAGTGATELFVREHVGLPLVAALPRADRHLRKIGKRDSLTLIAGGGLRSSADFAKCLALGADAVYIGTAALIAINCQQYRVCHTGLCPTGVTTNDPVLLERLDVAEGIRRLTNFMTVSTREMANYARIVGKNDVRLLGKEDLVALKRDLAELTGVNWLDGKPKSN